jgi:hypothetical protein
MVCLKSILIHEQKKNELKEQLPVLEGGEVFLFFLDDFMK